MNGHFSPTCCLSFIFTALRNGEFKSVWDWEDGEEVERIEKEKKEKEKKEKEEKEKEGKED